MNLLTHPQWSDFAKNYFEFNFETSISGEICKADYAIKNENNELIVFGYDINFEPKKEEIFSILQKERRTRDNSTLDIMFKFFQGNPKFVFVVSKERIYFMPSGLGQTNPYYWEATEDFLTLLNTINRIFPELKSKDEINTSLKITNDNLTHADSANKETISKLEEKIKSLKYDNNLLKINFETEIKAKNDTIKSFKEEIEYHKETIEMQIKEKLTNEQILVISESSGSDKQINHIYVYPSIILKTYIEEWVPPKSSSADDNRYNDDGIPASAANKFSWPKFNINFSYFLIKPNGEKSLIYNGKPEKREIRNYTDEESEKLELENDILDLYYYKYNEK